MANLNLLPRKEFQLTFDDGTIIKGQFGTYALNKFTEDRKIKLSEVSEVFKQTDNLSIIIDYIVCAAYQCYKQDRIKEPFTIEDVDIFRWVDEVGGFSSDKVTSLIGHASDGEKKTENPEGS